MVSGDLSVFPFLPVMQMFLSSGRSGQFRVDHPRGGALWFDNGEIVHARSGNLVGDDALQLMCSLDAGVFSFEPNSEPPERSLSLRQDTAMHRMLMDADAWSRLLPRFPTFNAVVVFTSRWTDQQPVTRPQFKVLSYAKQGFTLKNIIDQSGVPPRQVMEILQLFLDNGLVDLEDRTTRVM